MKTIPVSELVLLGAFLCAAVPAGGARVAPPEPRPSLEGLTRGTRAPGSTQLPPEILVDRHLVRMERLLAADDPEAALEVMNEILALQEEHDLVLENDFHFRYAEVAFAAGRTETAVASLNEYLVAAGREGEFYREALELLDSAELRLEREETARRRARRRAEVERRRADRWPPGHVFRDCETCPEMVVLPGSTVAMARYEVTLGEYRAFAAATGVGAGDCYGNSWRDPGFPQTERHPVTCMSWGRGARVCVVAEPADGCGVSVADGGGMGASGGGFSARVQRGSHG